MDKAKQVILVRKDIKMPKGKLGAQVAHASMSPILTMIRQDCLHYDGGLWHSPYDGVGDWLNGSFTKVLLAVDTLDEMLFINEAAKSMGIVTGLILDEGRTCFKEPTYTCCGIGPHTIDEINQITGHLKLF